MSYELLIRKGVYPYEYMTSWDRFEETQLPHKEAFYSRLNRSDISNEDCKCTLRVWSVFDMKSSGEYHDLYLKTGVILLANIFKAFRDTCLKHYSLNLAHFYTSTGLAWQACLKKMGIRLELLNDPDMLLMFDHGIRGGITQAVHRYAKASNKYMGEKFYPESSSSFLQYLDVNNLYGWVMSQPFPTGGFNWADPSQFTPDGISRLVSGNKGYLLEVDVRYLRDLHDPHSNLRIAS